MYFEGRELKSYAEPVLASELKEGLVYFSVQFIDEEMLIPIVEPLVFIGRNIHPGDVAQVYFQDAGSYRQGLRYESATSDHGVVFYQQSEKEINHIFEYERALDVLMACSLRYKKECG
jgi:hypothetical protein